MSKFLFSICFLVLLAGCKKSGEENTTIDPSDAQAVSNSVKIWHGERKTGNPPAPTNTPGSPQLDPFSDNGEVYAISGRYAVISPQVYSGSVAGYYIQIDGANDYFKVDYSKPRSGRLMQAGMNRVKRMQRLFGVDSAGNNADSAIIIDIPANIQPGQFCATYCVYDSLGNVSNPISVCINVTAFGGTSAVPYLPGTWHAVAAQYDNDPWEPILYMDTVRVDLDCDSTGITSCYTSTCAFPQYPTDINGMNRYDFVFGSNGGLEVKMDAVSKTIDWWNSSCTNILYEDYSINETYSGAWAYAASTNTLTMILDFNSYGIPDPQFIEVQLNKISDTEIHLFDPFQKVKLVK